MHHVPMAMVMSDRVTTRHLHSAEPGAPVVAERVRRRTRPQHEPLAQRGRSALAGALERAARVVAPRECSPIQ